MSADAASACRRCGACCRGEGDVRLRAGEAEAIARHLGVDVRAFIAASTRLTRDRRGLSITDQSDGSCAFLRPDATCAIHPVKPRQCRDFPARWTYPGYAAECAALRDRQSEEP